MKIRIWQNFTCPQRGEEISIKSTIVSVLSSELTPSLPFFTSECVSPPHLDPGGDTLNCGGGGGEGPIKTTGQKNSGTLPALCMYGSKITPTLTRPGDGLRQKNISRYCPFKVELEGEGRIRLVDDVFSRVCQEQRNYVGKE
jgi:hypothetical protein